VHAAGKLLGMHARTLQRRLAEEGTSFRDVIDGVRKDLAEGYVADRALTLDEVALLLGFSDKSAFHRAFVRWTGETPAAFRARAPR
jgi:AraC-like DNA-binding protein